MSGRRRFGSPRRLASGRWQARYRDPVGRLIAAPTTFPTKTDAARWLALVEADLARGEWRDPRLGQSSFGEWSERWLARPGVRDTTRARDRCVVRAHLLGALGTHPLSAITPLDVRRLVEELGTRLAPATVRTSYGVLRAILAAAVEAELIARTPCRGVHLPPDERAERAVLSVDDLARLADAMALEYRPVVYLGGVLGLRWSEVAGLRVRRVNFFRGCVEVAETLAEVEGHLIPAGPKSAAGRRTLAVPGFLMDMLGDHLVARGRPGPDAYVFVAPAGGPLRAANFRSRVWAPAVAAAELDDLTFHGLRHSAASLLVSLGEHPRVIQHHLGHSTARLSMELYAHVADDAGRALADRLGHLFSARSGTGVARPEAAGGEHPG